MSDQNTIEAYNKIAEEYSKRNGVTIWTEEYKIFSELVSLGSRVLEIGCGAGRDAEELIALGYDYVGTDVSEGMLTEARKRVPGAEFRTMDFYHLDFEPETFDAFWAAASLLHSPKKDIDLVLGQIRRVIKPGAVGFISLKRKTSFDEGMIKEEKAGGISRYFAFYQPGEFDAYLDRNGFEIIQVTERVESSTEPTVWFRYFVRKAQSAVRS